MFRLAWDFFLSFSFRAVFTLALFGGLTFLGWTVRECRKAHWQEEPEAAAVAFILAGSLTLIGLIGTFRRGKAEARFSLFSLVTMAATGILPVYAPDTRIGERTLRRFPSAESIILGSLLIALWLFAPIWQHETWVLRNAAILGTAQIIWGILIEGLGGAGRRIPNHRTGELSDGYIDTDQLP